MCFNYECRNRLSMLLQLPKPDKSEHVQKDVEMNMELLKADAIIGTHILDGDLSNYLYSITYLHA